MKILITGNLGYVGPSVVERLRATRPDARIEGLDSAFFAHCLTGVTTVPERHLDAQRYGDVRDVTEADLEGVDAIVHLAGISNDPIGNAYEDVTRAINQDATVELARRAKAAGVRTFTFASSCSIYGYAEDGMRDEGSELGPLTAYARSKAGAERGLEPLAGDGFSVTCLRFATACGMSPRLRLDLVLNDFVAGAIASGRIDILSDGTPWRPLIHVRDMARAADWAVDRADDARPFLAVNAGSDGWNHRVRDLADAVAEVVPGVAITVREDAPPDKRSYRVSFALFRELAPDHQPVVSLRDAIEDLHAGMTRMSFADADFRGSNLMRLKVLEALRNGGSVDADLRWTANGTGR